jgi:hypothetical protein
LHQTIINISLPCKSKNQYGNKDGGLTGKTSYLNFAGTFTGPENNFLRIQSALKFEP